MRVNKSILCVLILAGCIRCNSDNENKTDRRYIYSNSDRPDSKEEFTISETPKYLEWFKQYSSYIAEEKQFDSMVYAVAYQPVDFLVTKTLEEINIEEYKKERQEYEGMEYYLFSFGDITGSDVFKNSRFKSQNHDNVMCFFDFQIQKDFTLQDCYGEHPCVFYHLETDAGIRPYHTAIIAFERHSEQDTCDKTIVYKDHVFGSGIVKLTISKDKFELIPSLNILKNENI